MMAEDMEKRKVKDLVLSVTNGKIICKKEVCTCSFGHMKVSEKRRHGDSYKKNEFNKLHYHMIYDTADCSTNNI